MKKLLIFHPTIAPYRIDFFNDLNEAFDTRICLQYWNLRDQHFDYQKIYDQFKFIPVYLPDGSKLKQWQSVISQIREFKPDVVMTCEYGITTLLAIMIRGLVGHRFKIVVGTDDSYDMVNDVNDFTKRHRIARNLMAMRVDEIVVISPKVEKWYIERFKKGIYFPIIVNEDFAVRRYERLLPKSREYVKQYGLEGKKVLLSVSRLVELKNLRRVIDAFEKISSEAIFVIVGDGPERENLLEQAKHSGKEIVIAGRFDGDELYAWYNLASAFVLASYKEAFGAVTNEALLAGCRVIVSKRAGSSCLVDDNNGELIDPVNIDEIALAIDRQIQIADAPNLYLPRKSLMSMSYNAMM